jgi:hypothetical protein
VTLTLDLGTPELDATHLLMLPYNSVKFDSNPFNSKEVMAETRNTAILTLTFQCDLDLGPGDPKDRRNTPSHGALQFCKV